MTDQLVSCALILVGTPLIVYVMSRRSEARFRAASASALAELDAAIRGPLDEAGDDPDGDPLDDWDGPIVVETRELRGLIRAAVREALAEERAANAGPAPTPAVAAGS